LDSRVKPEQVVAVVAEYYGLSMSRLLGSPSRKVYIVRARSIAIWICRNILEMTLQDIGHLFGKHHTTILSSCDRVSLLLRTDGKFAQELDRVVRIIDPRHRILEQTLNYSFDSEEFGQMFDVLSRVIARAREQELATIEVSYRLLRAGSSPESSKRVGRVRGAELFESEYQARAPQRPAAAPAAPRRPGASPHPGKPAWRRPGRPDAAGRAPAAPRPAAAPAVSVDATELERTCWEEIRSDEGALE
jgi:Bacterial dnaA protein helix-turn-helix